MTRGIVGRPGAGRLVFVLLALLLVPAAGSATGQEPRAKQPPGARGGALREVPLPPARPAAADETSVLVRARGRSAANGRAIAADHGARAGRAIGSTGFVVAHTNGRRPADVLAELRRDPRVEAAQPNYLRRFVASPNDILLQKGDPQYYLPIMRLAQAWDLAQGSASVTIAVVDTGIDADHPELAGRVVAGYDFVGDDADPADDQGHGTMVAGVAAAAPNNGVGVAGSAWNASIMPLKVFDAEGAATDADIAAAITWAADHGADILNLSLGGPAESEVLRAAIDYAVSRDVLVVAASGNDGSTRPMYPAAYPGVLAVGATDWSGNVTGFSSYGDWLDVVAPGFRITSAYPAPGAEPAFASASGTSFSAPLVAGVAALVRAKNPTWTQAQVADQLRRTARDAGPRGIDSSYGYGIVDAYAAVGGPAAPPFRAPAGDPKEPNGTIDRAVALADPYYDWATISPQGDVDWFYKSVSSPGWVRFRVQSEIYGGNAEAEMTPMLQAYGPDLRPIEGGRLYWGTTSAELSVPVRTAGRYYLRVTSREGARSPELSANRPWGYTITTDFPTDPAPGRWDYARIPISSGAYSDSPEATAVGDVTGDGRADVLLTTSTYSDLALRLYAQRTDGYLERPVVLPTHGGGNSGLGVDIGDLDGDGKNDAAVAAGAVRVFFQRSGTLDPGVVVSDVQGAMQLRIADFDADGRRDIVVAWGHCTEAHGLALLRNTASGWVRTDTPTPNVEHELEVGDINGDGRLDVVGMSGNCTSGGVLDLFRRNADGTFTREAISIPFDMGGVEVADVTGDGRDDVVVARTGEILVYAQNPDGTLAAASALAAAGEAGAVESGDVNGDGRRDIVSEAGIFLRQSDGTWVREGGMAHSYYLEPNLLSLGDVNGDGKLDGAIADGTSPGYLALTRQASTTWPPRAWIRTTSPADFSEGAASSVTPTITFGRALAASSVTSSTVRLEDASTGTAVAATPSYDAATQTVTVRPAAPLAAGPYLVRIAGVADTSQTPMPEDTFRFTVGTTVDTTPPETYVTSGPWGYYIEEVGWDFMASEPGARFECHWGTSWQRCNSPNVFAMQPHGAHVNQFRAIDAAGNVDPTPVVRSYTTPPTNDAFAAAVTLSGASGTVVSTNTVGTVEQGEPYHGGNGGGMSVWYRWTAPSSGRFVFDTIGSTFDTLLGVYTGSSVGALTEVAGNDQALGTNWSKVSFDATAGTVYHVAIDGYSGERPARGTFTLTWAPASSGPDTVPPTVRLTAPEDETRVGFDVPLAAAATDDVAVQRVEFFANRTLVGTDTTAPYEMVWDVRGRSGYHTIEARAVDTAGNMDWSPPRRVYVDNTGPDTYIDSAPSATTTATTATFAFRSSIATATFECSLDNSAWTACTSPKSYSGLAYGFHRFGVRAVATVADDTPAYYGWTITDPATVPANDAFANAASITGPSGQKTGTTVGATREAGEPYHHSSTGSASIWYAWTAPASGTATFDTIGSTFDTILAAYTGSSLTALTRLTSDDDSGGNLKSKISFAASAGVTYRIAVDGYGSATGGVTLNWSLAAATDTTPPETTITSAPPASTTSTSASFAFSSSEAGSRFECSLDGAAFAACTSPKDYSGLAAASHTFRVRAIDAAGNLDASPASHTWTIGSASTGPANDNFASAQTIGGASGSATGTNVNATRETGEPYHYSSTGGRSIWYRWTAPASGTVTVDTVGSAFDTILAAYTGTALTSLTRLASDDDSAGNLKSRVSFTASAGATYQIAVDGYNGSSGAVTLNWSGPSGGDATPPTVSLTAPAAGALVRGSVTLSANASDNVSVATVEFLVNGSVVGSDTTAPYSVLWSSSTVADGTATIAARAVDGASNATTSASRSVTVDNTPPETAITSGPEGTVTTSSATFTFSSEAGATFECALDGGVYGQCASPKSYSGLANGSHTFSVRARDAAGNGDLTPAARTWTVNVQTADTTAPTVSLTAPADGARVRGVVTLTANASDNVGVASVQFLVGGTVVGTDTSAPYAYDWSTTGTPDGSVALGARALDAAGNSGSAPARTVTVDNTPPDTTITSGPEGTAGSSDATFSFTSTETGSTFECSLDGAAYTACSSPKQYTALANGPHTFQVRARDAAGNVDGTAALRQWTVNVLAPANLIQNGSFESSVSGWTAYRSSVTRVAGGSDGAYAAKVTRSSGSSFLLYTDPRPVTSSTAGRAYRAQGTVRSDAPGKRVCLVIREHTSGGTILAIAEQCVTTTAAWQPFPTVSYTTARSGGTVEVYAVQKSGSGGDTFTLDAVSLTVAG